MKHTPFIFFAFLCLLLAGGCGGTKKTATDAEAQARALPAQLIKFQELINQGKPKKARKLLIRWINTNG